MNMRMGRGGVPSAPIVPVQYIRQETVTVEARVGRDERKVVRDVLLENQHVLLRVHVIDHDGQRDMVHHREHDHTVERVRLVGGYCCSQMFEV
jgi:5-deoxy-D-glucuronate isomerase